MTEVSPAWLDRVVTARQRHAEASRLLYRLGQLLKAGDDESVQYNPDADVILDRDGTAYRESALSARLMQLRVELGTAEKHGFSIGPVLLGLTEVTHVLQDTVLNTEALLADAPAPEDPFIDRLEEHPAYERS